MGSDKQEIKSLYQKLGGESGMAVVVDAFYGKVLSDSELQKYFVAADMEKLKRAQKRFMAFVTGGPKTYSSRTMYYAHVRVRKLGVNEIVFNKVRKHLINTLIQFKASPQDIDQVSNIVLSVKKDILGTRKPQFKSKL